MRLVLVVVVALVLPAGQARPDRAEAPHEGATARGLEARGVAPPARSAGAVAAARGAAFLAANARKEGVVTLPSGLQYQVLKAGTGATPVDGDRVLCHYRGTFVDGTEFDGTRRRGRPATLSMERVIPGWREALARMPVGSRWRLFVPPSLAFGERGQRVHKGPGGRIGPQATLVYDAELLAILPRPAGPAGGGPPTDGADLELGP